MISYRFVPNSSQKGVLFFETPGMYSSEPLFVCFQFVLSGLVRISSY